MVSYPRRARERAMKVEEVILRATSKQITFWEAARILRYTPRHLRRVMQRYKHYGFEGLLDRRRGVPSPKRMPFVVVEQVLCLYREKYFDFSVRHFHEKLREQHAIPYSYTCIKRLLQGAGLVEKTRRCGPHRRRRPRRPMAGMLLHIDGSQHRWLGGDQWQDLIVVLDDATGEVYYAQLVEQESTLTVLAALRDVVGKHGFFCALYSDRASHFWLTPKEGEYVDRQRLTQVGRALRDLNIEMIPAYSPQARGRSERNFGTWQGRLPQELRLRGIATVQAANGFLRDHYIAEFNGKFRVAPAQTDSAFLPVEGQDLDRIFSMQHERVVQQDNTVRIANRVLQIEKHRWRGGSLTGQRVVVCEHLDRRLSVYYGPHLVGRYPAPPAAPEPAGNPAPPAGFPPTHDLPPHQRQNNSTNGQIMC